MRDDIGTSPDLLGRPRVRGDHHRGSAVIDLDSTADSTLAQCLVSAKVIGEEASEAVACFLTWRTSEVDDPCERLFFALGLLILAVRLRSGRMTEVGLGRTADWLLAEESAWRQELLSTEEPQNPRPEAFSMQMGFWQPLRVELLREACLVDAEDVRDKLELCALLAKPG